MTFHIRTVDDDHPIWKIVEQQCIKITSAVSYLIGEPDVYSTNEYVNAVAACADFVYGLSDLERLREPGEHHTVNYEATVPIIIANDTAVRDLVVKSYRAYAYNGYGDESDSDLELNRLCIHAVYARLLNTGRVEFYERQEHTVTTKRVKA